MNKSAIQSVFTRAPQVTCVLPQRKTRDLSAAYVTAVKSARAAATAAEDAALLGTGGQRAIGSREALAAVRMIDDVQKALDEKA